MADPNRIEKTTGDAGLFVSRSAEPAFRIALHFHQGVVEAIAVTLSGSRDELKLRRGSLCGYSFMRLLLPAARDSCRLEVGQR